MRSERGIAQGFAAVGEGHVGYREIAAVLLEWARIGRYAPGAQIPTEAELTRSFGVARVTVRRAIAQLIDAGVLESRHGAGTFVAESYVPAPVDLRVRLLGRARDEWGPGVVYRYLGERNVEPSADDAAFLKLKSGSKIMQFDYLRVDHGAPVEYATFKYARWVTDLIPERGEELMLHVSVYLRERGVVMSRSHRIARAAAATPQVADILKIKAGQPVMKFNASAWDQHDRPYLRAESIYRADAYELEYELNITRTPALALVK
ncbi:MAG: GntR family transcriptional regulator [Rhodospirillaceae bacterium]|nr:GntR family transcriptional regulator [Rhodospirillaceae bacterium]